MSKSSRLRRRERRAAWFSEWSVPPLMWYGYVGPHTLWQHIHRQAIDDMLKSMYGNLSSLLYEDSPVLRLVPKEPGAPRGIDPWTPR
jgi:hypothetical protein